MATLIGFGPSSALPNEPPDRPRAPKRRTLTFLALVAVLALLLPAGRGALSTATATRPAAKIAQKLGQVHIGALDAEAIARRVRPAIYSLDTNPEHQSAFAFATGEGYTYLATSLSNVVSASDIDNAHDFPKSGHPTIGGALIDPSFPIHQVVIVQHGSVSWRAQLINLDAGRDVALLRIKGTHPTIAIECDGPQRPRIADRVWLYSAGPNATAAPVTRSFGRIANFLPPEQLVSRQEMPDHGEGGPLVNIRGNVIGIAGRNGDTPGFRDFEKAFSWSTTAPVALELLGRTNECPEPAEGEEPADGSGQDGEPRPGTFAHLFENVVPAVLTVDTEFDNVRGIGSAFGVYSDGASTWVATNHHVLGDTRFFSNPIVNMTTQESVPVVGELVASSKDLDVALVRVDGQLPVIPPVCNPEEAVDRGDRIVAIGSPGDFEVTTLEEQRTSEEAGSSVPYERFLRPLGTDIYIPEILTVDPGPQHLDPGFSFTPWNDHGAVTITGIGTLDIIGVDGEVDETIPVEQVIAATADPYGMPHGSRGYLPGTFTVGKIRSVKFKDVRITAKLFHGNSGGPIVNMRGEVVAIAERFGKNGELFSINIERLFDRLAAKAGIPNPCAGVVTEEEGG